MLELLKLRKQHGYQAVPDLRNSELPPMFRGFPVLDNTIEVSSELKDICPANAIEPDPLRIDMGKCTFCGACEKLSNKAISFSPMYKLGTTSRERLIIKAGETYEQFRLTAIESKKEIKKLFGKSLKLRQVSAGGCNGCEMELAACSNVNFDMARFGIDFVASPRHADGIVITGPISKNMAPALMDCYKSVSDPKIVIAAGTCAISGGIFADSHELNREFLNNIKVDLYIPGCPVHPLTFINAVLDFIGHK